MPFLNDAYLGSPAVGSPERVVLLQWPHQFRPSAKAAMLAVLQRSVTSSYSRVSTNFMETECFWTKAQPLFRIKSYKPGYVPMRSDDSMSDRSRVSQAHTLFGNPYGTRYVFVSIAFASSLLVIRSVSGSNSNTVRVRYAISPRWINAHV